VAWFLDIMGDVGRFVRLLPHFQKAGIVASTDFAAGFLQGFFKRVQWDAHEIMRFVFFDRIDRMFLPARVAERTF